jgi:ABC-2 type transport system permease protein
VLIQVGANPEDAPPTLEMVFIYTIFGGMATGVGVIIAMQGAVVGEKQSGTAAWVLSKPVSRPAFILSKAIGNSAGLLFTAVFVPGVIAYLEFWFLYFHEPLPVLDFLAGMSILGLHTLFWLSLTLMLGTFFNAWGPVIGIPMALLFGQQFLAGMAPQMVYVLPWAMVSPIEGVGGPVAAELIQGLTPFSWLPVIFTALMTVVFLIVAVWRFRREEL